MNTSKKKTLQDIFLTALREEKIPVFVYLINGIRLQGIVEAFDPQVIVLKSAFNHQLTCKRAIATIVPASRVNCTF